MTVSATAQPMLMQSVVAIDTLSPQQISTLKEKVRMFRVVYEVTSAVRIVDGERRAIGFDITLCGTHPKPKNHVLPGCSHYQKIYQALQEIAKAVLPEPGRISRYVIRGFDRAYHQAPLRNLRKDIELVVEIRHREGYLDPVDPCEQSCLAEIKRNLSALCVPFKQWNI